MIDDKNKLEKLEDKVNRLEKELKEKTTKIDAIKEAEARLAGYQDIVRTEKNITLREIIFKSTDDSLWSTTVDTDGNMVITKL